MWLGLKWQCNDSSRHKLNGKWRRTAPGLMYLNAMLLQRSRWGGGKKKKISKRTEMDRFPIFCSGVH